MAHVKPLAKLYNMEDMATIFHSSDVDKSLPKPSWFVGGYLTRLNNSCTAYSQNHRHDWTPFDKYVVKKRGYLKFQFFKICRNLEDRFKNHPGMVKEEQEKIDQALRLLSEVMESKSWNTNTLHLKNTEKL